MGARGDFLRQSGRHALTLEVMAPHHLRWAGNWVLEGQEEVSAGQTWWADRLVQSFSLWTP